MRIKTYLLSLPIGIIGWAITAATANAAYFTPLSGYTDTDLNQELETGSFVEEFKASSYIGDGGGVFQELQLKDIVPPNGEADLLSSKEEQFLWANEQAVKFELKLDHNILTYKVGDTVLESVDVIDSKLDLNGMILSAKSTNKSKVELKDLYFEGDNEFGDLFSKGGKASFLKITGIDNTFTLTGTQVFSWLGERPTNFDLAYDIRVGTFQEDDVEIPEPTTISFLSLGVLAIAVSRRRPKYNK